MSDADAWTRLAARWRRGEYTQDTVEEDEEMPVLMFESLLDMLRRDMALGGRRVRNYSVDHPSGYEVEVRVTWDDPKVRPTIYVFDAKSGRLRESRQESG